MRDVSPPRERKPSNPQESRKFSWATQRIHELTKELEAAQARIKVRRVVCVWGFGVGGTRVALALAQGGGGGV